MRPRLAIPLILSFTACAEQRYWENADDWFDDGDDYAVSETVSFTDQSYEFPASQADGIANLAGMFDTSPFASWVQTRFGTEDLAAAQLDPDLLCEWEGIDDLPMDIEGVVTITPDFYFKSSGCDSGSDEKYYGSYFIEDNTGGIMVLGDSKVGHFDVGNKVRMRVRGLRLGFGLPMVYAHDILEVDYAIHDVHYTELTRLLEDADIGGVRRVTGTVRTTPDTFGQTWLELDDQDNCKTRTGEGCVGVSLDSELTRRGFTLTPGQRVQVTGPVLFSYDIHNIVVMRVGQVEHLDD